MLSFEEVKASANLAAIVGQYVALKAEGGRYVGLCPFHEERTGSFKIEKGETSWHCYGCGLHGDAVDFVQRYEGISKAEALRRVAECAGVAVPATEEKPLDRKLTSRKQPAMEKKASRYGSYKFVESYDYVLADGSLSYQVIRKEALPLDPNSGLEKDKKFSQRWKHSDGSWVWAISEGHFIKSDSGWGQVRPEKPGDPIPSNAVSFSAKERLLFNLPAVIDASDVFVTEGEKDANTLIRLGFTATSASGGASQQWLQSFTDVLRGKRVVIFPDNDERGEQYGRRVEKGLTGSVAELLYVPMPKGFKDVTEYVEAGYTAEDIQALISAVKRELIEKEDRHRGLLTPLEIVDRFPGGLEAFIDASKRPHGLKTGFHKFDEMTLGLHPGELTILAARPAAGKSAIAGNIATYVGMKQGKGVAIFNMEMARFSILQRMVCSVGQIDAHKYRSGWLNDWEKREALQALYDISEHHIRVDDTAGMTLSEFERKLNIMRDETDLSLVVIDYLQQITPDKTRRGSGANRVNDVSDISRGLKMMTMQMNLPFLVLSQLSRACELRPGDHRPVLSDLRESGSLEMDADNVGFVYREEMYRPDKESVRGIAELILSKQRNGPTGTTKLAYISRYTKFENLAEPYMEAA